MPETRRLTEADIIKADTERIRQAHWLALAESGPYPGDHSPISEMRKWRNHVERLARKIAKRSN